MRTNLFRSLAVMAALTGSGHAVIINWGSLAFSSLSTSNGYVMPETFHFELGAFDSGFNPATDPLVTWFDHWHVFDRADYDAGNGVFTSSARMTDAGRSSYADASNLNFNFQELNAYLWIHNDKVMAHDTGGEWLLIHNTDPLLGDSPLGSAWVFPKIPTPPDSEPLGCCDNAPPINWSVSDLGAGDVPLYGYQNGGETPGGGVRGAGDFTWQGNYALQTYTMLPEPSSAVMVLVIGVLGLLDRRRSWCL